MKKAIIYTRTGDAGETSLIGGKRVPKDHPRVEAYGTLDELSAQLGILATTLKDEKHRCTIEQIEKRIISISTSLADESCNTSPIDDNAIKELEHEIDRLDSTLPPIQEFLLPGKNFASAQANMCRTVCRRAERRIVTLKNTCPVIPETLVYVNRISDYLFTLSRCLNNEK